jgi:polyisoprenoid-binding protein YceI
MKNLIQKCLILCLLLLSPSSAQAEQTNWQLDKTHTTVGFMVKHMGITRIRGTFGKFDASVKADKDTALLSALSASVVVESIDTGLPKRDDHLQKKDFFNSQAHPEAKFELKKIEFNQAKFKARIDVTIRSIRKSIEFEGELLGIRNKNFDNTPGKRAGYTLKGVINRQDFGLSFNKFAEGVSVVSDDVTIEIDFEITRKL